VVESVLPPYNFVFGRLVGLGCVLFSVGVGWMYICLALYLNSLVARIRCSSTCARAHYPCVVSSAFSVFELQEVHLVGLLGSPFPRRCPGHDCHCEDKNGTGKWHHGNVRLTILDGWQAGVSSPKVVSQAGRL